MSAPLLLTKLNIPQTRSELVHRPRLIDQIEKGSNKKLTLVSAPAGFGKTTLITDWLKTKENNEESPFHIAWLSLDDGENEPIQFLSYFLEALIQANAIDELFGKGLQNILQTPQPLQADSILISLLNEISNSPVRILIILDDYHRIEAQPVHDMLTYLLENLPPSVHVVITTREDPNLPLARMRVGGKMSELRAKELRFSSEEAGEFLNKIMGLDLSVDDIAVLEYRTEGWIAGLQLAAISMQGHDDVSNFVQSFSGSDRLVLDYLIEEVINQQSEVVQDFLLKTSILNRFTGSLCDTVTGQRNGQAMIEMLDRTNLFVISLDSDRKWYRYHHLFSDFLNRRLQQTQNESLPELHNKVSEWFEQQGADREAIRHSLAAMDYEKACMLIESISINVMEQGEHSTIIRWINSLPDEVIKDKPYLYVLHAWALLLSGQIEAAESRLIDAENVLNIQGNSSAQRDNKTIYGLIHSNRAYLNFLKGKHVQTIDYAQKALIELPEKAALFRSQTGIYLGVAHRYRGQLQEAFDIYNEILPITKQLRGKIAVQCRQNLGDLLQQMAKLTQSQSVLEEALQITELHVGRPEMPYCGFIYLLLGRILYQRNELSGAQQMIEKGFNLCRELNLSEYTALSCLDLANINWALGNQDQARKSFQEAIQIFSGFSLWGKKYAEAYLAKFEIAQGNIESAESWALSNDLTTESNFEFHREIEYFAFARLLIVQKKFLEATPFIERLKSISQETKNKRSELESLVLLSISNFQQGKVEEALENLHKALVIAEPECFIRVFVDEGPVLARVLYEALSRGISPDYVQQVLAAFPVEESEQVTIDQKKVPGSEWIEPLSERELEVLQLIAKGLSRQEIASQLVLSLNTVKTHARNIFSKLRVNNQMQAVGKARTLGILDLD